MSNIDKADQALRDLVAANSAADAIATEIVHTVAAGMTVAPEVRVSYAKARVAATAAEDAYLAAADTAVRAWAS